MNGCLAYPQSTVYSKYLAMPSLFFFNHMNAPNFNPAHSYVVSLVIDFKKRVINVMILSLNSLGSPVLWPFGNTWCSTPYLTFLIMFPTFLILIHFLISSLQFLPLMLSQLILTFNECPHSILVVNHVDTIDAKPHWYHQVRTLSSHLHSFHCFSTLSILHEPHTFCEASFDPLWQQDMTEESDALLKTGTWNLVDLATRKLDIGYKWVCKIKTQLDGTIDRYKAYLVAKGFTQEYEIDYEETFALMACFSSIHTLIAVSTSCN